jgi:hypothetical protein
MVARSSRNAGDFPRNPQGSEIVHLRKVLSAASPTPLIGRSDGADGFRRTVLAMRFYRFSRSTACSRAHSTLPIA